VGKIARPLIRYQGFFAKGRLELGNSFRSQENDHDLPLFHKKKKGQALIELVLTLPILILLVVGALEIGRVLYSKMVITNAAREGAYFLSYNPGSMASVGKVVNAEFQNYGAALTNVAITTSGCCSPDNPVTVTVQACVNNLYLLTLFSKGSCGNSATQISNSVKMLVVH
jgi:Flp pilus assembly protein TadG